MLTIYGKPNCQQCQMAKLTCDMNDIPYEYKHLGLDFEIDFIVENYKSHKEFPLILKDGVYFGGYKDLKSSLEYTE